MSTTVHTTEEEGNQTHGKIWKRNVDSRLQLEKCGNGSIKRMDGDRWFCALLGVRRISHVTIAHSLIRVLGDDALCRLAELV